MNWKRIQTYLLLEPFQKILYGHAWCIQNPESTATDDVRLSAHRAMLLKLIDPIATEWHAIAP